MNCVTFGSLNSDDLVIDVMTKTIFQNWKVIAGLSIAAVLLGSVFSFGLFTPKAEAGENGMSIGFEPCGFDDTLGLLFSVHYDKIIFQILRDPSGVIPPNFLKTELDIKVVDFLDEVADIKQKVRNFLIAHGIGLAPTLDPDVVSKLKIDIIDVEYAIACEIFSPGK